VNQTRCSRLKIRSRSFRTWPGNPEAVSLWA